ncbi:MAG: helix-turn-helix domain-containing protein [Bacteroidetes bacterium]|nr:helix-turn-helix domain-containing protein [Bacteroidota bacterium]MCL2303253.1 helix-turn-helix domain-containing protein [Lentimicrobiaceae bacterium]
MRAFLLAITILTASHIALAQNDFQHTKDSLLQALPSAQGKEKLEIYKMLCVLPIHPDQLDEYLKLSEEFIVEAKKQQNIKIEAEARHDELTKLFNYGRRDELFKKVDDYLHFFAKNEQWKQYYDAWAMVIEAHIFEGRKEKAMLEAEQLYKTAKKSNNLIGIEMATYYIGLVYNRMGRDEEAEKYYKETISLSRNDNTLNHPRRRAYEELCQLLLKKQEYQKAIELVEDLNQLYENYFKENPAYISNKLFAMLIYYRVKAEAYWGLGDLEQSEHYCNLSEEIAPREPRAMSFIYHVRAKISEKRKEYEKSIEELDKALQFYTVSGIAPFDVLMYKARVLCIMGRGIEAFPIYEAVMKDKAASFEDMLNSQLDELRTQYEVDKHIAEKERNRNYFLFALGGCLLLTIALIIWITLNRKIAKKNRTLAQQIKTLTTQQEEQVNEMLTKTSFVSEEETEDVDGELNPESRMDKLCLAIRDLILKDKIYRNPNLTRDLMVECLGTNRRLFADAFEYCFKMPFIDYINGLRLKDAVILLEQSDFSIEEIADTSGFGTVRTFQRQFSTKYNMSPKEYRGLVIND